MRFNEDMTTIGERGPRKSEEGRNERQRRFLVQTLERFSFPKDSLQERIWQGAIRVLRDQEGRISDFRFLKDPGFIAGIIYPQGGEVTRPVERGGKREKSLVRAYQEAVRPVKAVLHRANVEWIMESDPDVQEMFSLLVPDKKGSAIFDELQNRYPSIIDVEQALITACGKTTAKGNHYADLEKEMFKKTIFSAFNLVKKDLGRALRLVPERHSEELARTIERGFADLAQGDLPTDYPAFRAVLRQVNAYLSLIPNHSPEDFPNLENFRKNVMSVVQRLRRLSPGDLRSREGKKSGEKRAAGESGSHQGEQAISALQEKMAALYGIAILHLEGGEVGGVTTNDESLRVQQNQGGGAQGERGDQEVPSEEKEGQKSSVEGKMQELLGKIKESEKRAGERIEMLNEVLKGVKEGIEGARSFVARLQEICRRASKEIKGDEEVSFSGEKWSLSKVVTQVPFWAQEIGDSLDDAERYLTVFGAILGIIFKKGVDQRSVSDIQFWFQSFKQSYSNAIEKSFSLLSEENMKNVFIPLLERLGESPFKKVDLKSIEYIKEELFRIGISNL